MKRTLWNRCFFCSSPLSCEDEEYEDDWKKEETKPSIKLLFKYLLSNAVLNQPLYENVLQFVTSEESSKLKVCLECGNSADLVLKMQMELEVIQMKIVKELESLTKGVISNSRFFGRNIEAQEDFDKVEECLLKEESAGKCCDQERVFLDVLHQFQSAIAVFEHDNRKLRAPLVYLKKYIGEQMTLPSLPETAEEDMEYEDVGQGQDDAFQEIVDIKLEDEIESTETTTISTNVTKCEKKIRKRKSRQANKISDRKSISLIKRSKTHLRPTIKASLPKKNRKILKLFANRKWTCNQCGLIKLGETHYLIHRVEGHLISHETDEKNLHCSKCDSNFTHKQYLDFHKEIMHTNPPKNDCDVCEVRVRVSTKDMKSHLLETHSERIYKCKDCYRVFGLFQNLVVHKIVVHKMGKTYMECKLCPETDKTSYLVRSLIPHFLETHQIDVQDKVRIKPYEFVCKLCPEMEFTANSKLQAHLLDSHGVGMFTWSKCFKCSKRFKRKDQLEKHEKTHKEGWDHVCDKCSYVTNTKKNFARHVKDHHTDEKDHICCDKCSYVTNKKNHLVRHVRNHHTDEIDHVHICDKCCYMTRDKSQFLRHVKEKHSGEPRPRLTPRPNQQFKCPDPGCEKVFSINGALKRHMVCHNEERPFQCDECGFAFKRKSDMKDHLKSVHKISS